MKFDRSKWNCVIIATALAMAAPAAPGHIASANTSWVEVFACPKGISVFTVEDDVSLNAPTVDFQVAVTGTHPSTIYGSANVVGAITGPGVPGGGKGRQYVYWSDTGLTAGQTGTVRAKGVRNESYAGFTVASDCPPLGSVRGSAFEDLNHNGVRDPGEPNIGTASWKLTTGGNWFLCGYVGSDSTFGPTVKPGTYTLIPIAQPGWRATTPVRTALVRKLGEAALNNDIGFVRSSNSRGDVCSGYTPPGIPPGDSVSVVQSPDALRALANNHVFTRLFGALQTTGLAGMLSASGPFTLLAPTDIAFSRLPRTTYDRLTRRPQLLLDVLKCHVILGTIDVKSLGPRGKTFPTLGARSVTFRVHNGVLYANNAIVGDVLPVSNGSVLVIDRVLFAQ